MAVRPLIICDPEPADETAWRALWAQYIAFYEAEIPEKVTALTWRHLIDPAAPMFGRLALVAGEVLGFSIGVPHDSTWTLTPVCYLEGLFVAPVATADDFVRYRRTLDEMD